MQLDYILFIKDLIRVLFVIMTLGFYEQNEFTWLSAFYPFGASSSAKYRTTLNAEIRQLNFCISKYTVDVAVM